MHLKGNFVLNFDSTMLLLVTECKILWKIFKIWMKLVKNLLTWRIHNFTLPNI